MKIAHMFLSPPSPSATTYAERYGEVMRMIDISNGKGYEAVWFTEHHFSDYGSFPNPILFLAHVARVAPEMRLGTAIALLPLWHPLRLAEDIASLDALSGGRVDFGIGRGYQAYEYDRLGVRLEDNRDQFGESYEIMQKAWTMDDFSHEGRFWSFGSTSVFPKPVQQPIPIWMAATSPPSIRAALANGWHIMTGTGGDFQELEQRNAFIDTALKRQGRAVDEIERSTTRFAFCSNSEAEIDQYMQKFRDQLRCSRALSSGIDPVAGRNTPIPYSGEPELDSWRDRLLVGTPDECIKKLQRMSDVGMTYIHAVFDIGLPHDVQMRSVELFSREVMPAVAQMGKPKRDDEQAEISAKDFVDRKSYYSGI